MSTTYRDDPAAVLADHRAIRAAIQALQADVRLPPPSGRARWLRRLSDDTRALAELLRPHFEREEAEGLFEAIEEREPAAARECAQLRSEHGALLDRLTALEHTLQAPLQVAAGAEEMRRAILGLLTDLGRHEASENALLVRAMEGEEVGALD